jgi:hypothetical protein
MDVVRARWNFVGLIVAGLREVECVCVTPMNTIEMQIGLLARRYRVAKGVRHQE